MVDFLIKVFHPKQTNWNFFQSLSESLNVSRLLCPSHSSHLTKVIERQLKWFHFSFFFLVCLKSAVVILVFQQNREILEYEGKGWLADSVLKRIHINLAWQSNLMSLRFLITISSIYVLI